MLFNWTFGKGYGLLPLAKNMRNNISKNLSTNYSLVVQTTVTNYSQKRNGHNKKSATDALKTLSEKVIQK